MGYFDITTTVLPLPSDPRNKGIEPRPGLTKDEVPGYWVEIKDELDFGDISYRNKRVIRLQSKGFTNLNDAVGSWEIDQFSQATLERAIVEWNLDQGAGRQKAVLPVKSDTVAMLKSSDAAYLLAEVMKRNLSSSDEADQEGKAAASSATTKPSMGESEPSPTPPDSAS
jgi:hypothetical protein